MGFRVVKEVKKVNREKAIAKTPVNRMGAFSIGKVHMTVGSSGQVLVLGVKGFWLHYKTDKLSRTFQHKLKINNLNKNTYHLSHK